MSLETPDIDPDPSTSECRACLKKLESKQLYNLFQAWQSTWDGMKNTIAEDLAVIADIQLKETDKCSKKICLNCCNSLWTACKFRLLVQANDRILRRRLLESEEPDTAEKEWPQPIQVEKSIIGAYNNPLEIEIKQEVLTDDENMQNGDDGYTNTDCLDMIKIEPEEIVEPVTSAQPIFQAAEINGQQCFEEELQKVKEEPPSESEDTECDLPMDCLLCARSFNSVSGLKAHVIAQHSYQTVERKIGDTSPHRTQNNKYVCATCRRTFVTSTDLMVHETCHNKHICYGCSAKFDTFEQLTKHRRRCKALSSPGVKRLKTLDDVKRPHQDNNQVTEIKIEINSVTTLAADSQETLSCSQCNEVFTDPYYMKIHQEVHHVNSEPTLEMNNGAAPMEIEALESIFNEEL